ncbi:hypothetical protein AcW1_009925 [Taiwanofungus camphoratus]|nr:hypothetical protein AcV5_003239 [Antrodia cinnamomea]KAI0929423.1 hypothetical protein AcV7_005277 [Antrodia cinnamomea]KAI0946473.1 hypothetical protein AcW1_009925 [Antrodia cinnamomea]
MKAVSSAGLGSSSPRFSETQQLLSPLDLLRPHIDLCMAVGIKQQISHSNSNSNSFFQCQAVVATELCKLLRGFRARTPFENRRLYFPFSRWYYRASISWALANVSM